MHERFLGGGQAQHTAVDSSLPGTARAPDDGAARAPDRHGDLCSAQGTLAQRLGDREECGLFIDDTWQSHGTSLLLCMPLRQIRGDVLAQKKTGSGVLLCTVVHMGRQCIWPAPDIVE